MWSSDKLKPLFPQLSIDTTGLQGDLYVYLYFSLHAANASLPDIAFFQKDKRAKPENILRKQYKFLYRGTLVTNTLAHSF
jgi:hypothetical protein